MFSIENYIKELIISKVEKFVRNINTEELKNQFKVSLWEGDVVFQNLELKLDVLDEELQIPFTFLSGFIKYLKIQIPWTKIGNEPINLTINDSELVVKLKDPSTYTPPKPKAKNNSLENDDSSGGYIASLVAKIVNNISVICNNVSIKFLEDDIVFSMNIPHLSVYSADSKWKRAFTDVSSASNVIFRKLVNIIDLTICLDKRNSLGKIEYVQEPFLYKCSMELRIFRKYNSLNPEKSSIMRIDLQTKAININISSQQIEVLVRLLELVLALKSGQLFDQNKIQATNLVHNENTFENDESWMLWMWNMVPTIMSNDIQTEDIEANSKKIFEFGMYIENTQVAFKSQELISDPIIPSAKKPILKPLLELNIKEMHSITIICGNRYFNVKGGANSFDIKALDDCPCGFNKTSETYIIKAGLQEQSNGAFLNDSYFNKNFTAQNKYREMFNNYFEKNNEEIMLSKVAIAFDILHSVEIPDDHGSSDIGSDLEYSNFSENYTVRVFGDKINFYLSSDAIHRFEKIVQYYNECDFSSYTKNTKVPTKSQLSPATADDYEALINETPERNIILKIRNSNIHVLEWNHEKVQRNLRKVLRQSSFSDGCSQSSAMEFIINFGDFMMKIESPLYKNRLVFTACQLPDNIQNELFQKCFVKIQTNIKNIVIDMKDNSAKKICEILKISYKQKNLIYPTLWEEYDIKHISHVIELNGLSFMMNAPQFYAFFKSLNSMIQRVPTCNEISRSYIQNFNNPELVVLQLTSRIVKINISKLSNVTLSDFTISDLIGIAWKRGSKSIVFNIPDKKAKSPQFSSKEKEFTSDAIFRLCIQIPNVKTLQQNISTVVSLETSEGCINLDPLLREFLSFQILKNTLNEEKEYKRTLSTSTKPILNELSHVHESSLPSSSEYQDTLCPSAIQTTNKDNTISDYLKMFRNCTLFVFIRPINLYYSTKILESFKTSDSIGENLQSEGCDAIVLTSPNVVFHSVKNKCMMKHVSGHFPVNLQNILWGNDKSLTWNLALTNINLHILSEKKMFEIIQDISMKVSIADESQLENIELYSGNILVEIFPLFFTFHTSKIDLLSSAIKEIYSFTIFNIDSNHEKQKEKITYNEETSRSALDIKDFLGLPTGSTITKTSLPEYSSKKNPSNMNFYIQIICSKVCLTFIADSVEISKKFVMEIDETLFSLHQQEYFQLKCKITSISGNHFHYEVSSNQWLKNLNLGFNIQSDQNVSDTITRFFDITVTKAETSNVHSKWNLDLKKNSQLILSNVSEINVILQSFDVIVSDEISDFLPLIKVFQGNSQKNQKNFMHYSGSDLPLVHMNCNGFRIFLPNLDRESNPNVFILKVNNVTLTPNAINNLIRSQIIRPDIVNKASNLGILDLVGSKIEDRQYQLIAKGCSLNSSNWNDITDIICEKNVENFDNPATIWNNLENFQIFPNFKCNNIFKDSSFSIIYAPCIKFKEVIIAGSAIEINCIENMNIVLSLEQIILFIDLSKKSKSFGKLQENEKNTVLESTKSKTAKACLKIPKKKRFMDKKSNDDSGVASTISNSYQFKTKKVFKRKPSVLSNEYCCNNGSNVPYEFTFTSSKFNFNFAFESKNKPDSIFFELDTPNLYMTHNGNEKYFNLSLFDMKIGNETSSLFTTRHGNLNSISGITNSLFRMKINEKSLRNSEFSVEFGRSIYIKVWPEILTDIRKLKTKLKLNAFQKTKYSQSDNIRYKTRKFDGIKSIMSNFKIINVKTDQILINSTCDKSQFTFGVQNIKGKLKLFDRPEKLESNIEVTHITAKCENNIFIHPLSIEAKLKIIQEYWKNDPLLYLNIVTNYVKLDLWPSLVIDLQNFVKSVTNTLIPESSPVCSTFNNFKSSKINKTPCHVEKIQIYPKAWKINEEDRIEHFSDDLRSGIYTLVEVPAFSFQELPLPYQIHYQKSEIIWRYPLPRTLHKIKIFPAPLQTCNQIRLDCKIEYYSQLKSQFEELISLSLNENETKLLDINESTMFAEVWRIKFKVNIKRDSDDEEYDGSIETELNYIQMHPKVLLACLRIDSYYNASAVPIINSLINIPKIDLNIFNQDMVEEHLEKNEVVQILSDSIQIFGQHYDESFHHFVCEGSFLTNIKDYGCKNLIPLVKKFYVKASLDRKHYSDTSLNLVASKIRLSYSPAIGHSLLSSFKLWSKINDFSKMSVSKYVKYRIYNNTGYTLSINQLNIDEKIHILPKTYKHYQFFTDKEYQELQISINSQCEGFSEKTEPFNINMEGIQYIKCDEHLYFIILVKNSSNYQRNITIDGQVYIRNMTNECFDIQYKRYDKDINNVEKCEFQEIGLDKHDSRSFFGNCEYDSQQTIRLHLRKCDKRLFSGEIPLREIVTHNKPWLVKVPLDSNNKFICYWVRIIRQLLKDDKICRVLILICPAFMAKSLFPCDIILTEENTKEKYQIKGSGQSTEFEMKGTHENEHRLLFPDNHKQKDDNSLPPLVTLSYNLVNKSIFFKIPDEYSDIGKAIEKLDEEKLNSWPYKQDEDYQVMRDFTMNPSVTTLYELSSVEPEGLCCSLMLTLIPSCVLINSTGVKIRITNCSKDEKCFLESNNLTVPFYIEDAFLIGMNLNDEWIDSAPILINEYAKKKFPVGYDLIEGNSFVSIYNNSETVQLMVNSKSSGKRRTISINTLVIISNYSSYKLGIIPFCVDSNEKIGTWKKNEFPTKRYVRLHTNLKDGDDKMGNPISIYSNIAKYKGIRKHGVNYTSFFMICSTLDESEFSCSIKIQSTLRKCVNIYDDGQSKSISISILKHNEQFFVSLFNDFKPILNLINNTDFNLYVAQADLKHQSIKNIMPHRETADERFTWYQVVNAKQNVFYTPPIYSEFYPEIINHEYGLIFACVCGDEIIRWSIPVKIDETKKIIINVPMFGDLKLLVDMKKITSKISINYIDSDKVSFENSFEVQEMSLIEAIDNTYCKTFIMSKRKKQSMLNLEMYLEGVNLMVSRDDVEKRINLISLSIDDIVTIYSKISRNLKINFSRIQIDNELFSSGNYDFPVLLCNKDLPKGKIDRLILPILSKWNVQDIIQKNATATDKFSIEFNFYEWEKHVKNVLIRLLPMRIYIEDAIIHTILELTDECLSNSFADECKQVSAQIHLTGDLVLIPKSILNQSFQLSEPIILHSFRLDALHVLLSVHTCKHLFIALDHSPLDFSAYEKNNIYTVPMKLGNNFGMHYISSAIFGAGWVLGSLEILGSPSGLARSFTSGFKDFVSMPIQGIFKGPFGFLAGLTHGSASLFKNVTTGTLNSVTKLANSLARNLDNLTLDNEHIYLKTDTLRRSRPQGFTDGLQLGLTGFGINILGAIGGLSRHPLQAKNVTDVFTGVGKGLIGVVTKPISGIAELVAFMGSGVLQSVGYNVLPNPLNQEIRQEFSIPNVNKIINRQLPHYATDPILMTCHATYVDKNDLKYSFLILNSKSLIIVDERDFVNDVILLEDISPITHKASSLPDNLFILKIKKKKSIVAGDENIEKYHVSKRTVLYVKQLTNQNFSENLSSYNEENERDSDENETESLIGAPTNIDKISFYIDSATGKYLMNYISLVKYLTSSKENSFPLFEDVK